MAFADVVRSVFERVSAPIVRAFARTSQKPYLEYCFAALGRISKSSGRVTEAHINYAEALMRRLEFSADDRAAAVGWFNTGKNSQTDFHALAQACNRRNEPVLRELITECMIAVAQIQPAPAANRTVKLLTSLICVDNDTLLDKQTLISEEQAAIAAARALLRVERNYDEATLKSRYRQLIHRYHPDKLPPDAPQGEVQAMQSRTVEIRAAYDLLKSHAANNPG